MRKNLWITMAVLLAAGASAQTVTDAPPASAIAAPSTTSTTNAAAPAVTGATTTKTNAAAKVSGKKKSKKASTKSGAAKKPSFLQIKTEPLSAGPATVIASNVNVRGQAKLNSEVITKIQKGQMVTVLEEVNLTKSGPEEPSAWARIILPETAHAWVNSKFIDATNKTVIPKSLKLRGGPGENYSILGFIKQGDSVKETSSKGDWIQIEAPAEASGFVAAQYLRQEAGSVSNAAPEIAAATPTTVTDPTNTVAPATEPTAPAPEAGSTNTTVASTSPAGSTNEAPAGVEEPPPPRIVQREGIVRGTFSIQAPTKYELVSVDTHRPINYLYAESKDLDLSRYKGMRIIVTGPEGLDERWRNTPVITIQKINVLE